MFGGGGRHESAWAGDLLGRFAERCAYRGSDDDAELGWQPLPNGHFVLTVPEGKLVTSLQDVRRGLWNLYMQWGDGHGDKFIAQASRRVIERLARQIRRAGPPGGPDFRGQQVAWRHYNDETEHAVAIGGGLRLMPPALDDDEDDGGVLLLAHNDPNGSVSVLGIGEHDDLQDEAAELGRRPGPRVRLSLGGRWRYLQVIGAAGIVGYLELDDDLFVLGHLGGDKFGLACQSGGVQRGIRTYSLDEVKRGDLGAVQDWADAEDPPRTRRPRVSRPSERRARPAPQRRDEPLDREGLGGTDLIGALIHLTPEDDITGEAAWTIPKVLDGIRGLVQLSIGNKIDWAMGILQLIREETGQQIHCCAKIANACLHWISRHTKLVVARGRKYELRCGDLRQLNSALLRWMIRRGPLDLKPGRRRRAKGGDQQPATPGEPADTTTVAGQGNATPATPLTSPPAASSPPVDAAPAPQATTSPADAPTTAPTVDTPASLPTDHPAPATVAHAPLPLLDTGGLARGQAFATFSCETSVVGTTTAATASGLAGTGASVCDQQPDAPPVVRPAKSPAWPSPPPPPATHRPSSPLLASMSLDELTAHWVAEVERLRERLADHPGLMPEAKLGTRSGWVRRVAGKRVHRPP